MSDVMRPDLARGYLGQRTGAQIEAQLGAELRSWALIAIGSLAVAGCFALLLAVSRLPGIEKVIPWPIGFFSKGLVIHVVFSLVIWFLAMFALLSSFAVKEAAGGDLRYAGLGRIGLGLVSMSFPMLFVPAFDAGTVATLNNYVPVIIHPAYYAGLVLLALGILMPVVRLLLNIAGRPGHLEPLPFAMTMGGLVYTVALASFAAGVAGVWGEAPSRMMHDDLFWGGGHVLQFLYCLLMLTGWALLARRMFGIDVIDPDVFRLATGLIGVFSLGALLFIAAFEPFSEVQREAFRRLQFVLSFPTLLVAVGGLVTLLRRRQTEPLPWREPAFVALVMSVVVFGAGGIMGLLITGSDTRTPAHYHGVIAGVHLACMGLMLTYCLPSLQRPAPGRVRLSRQILMFGTGQLMASCGLFLAGGYGAPRKTPSGAIDLADGAVIGMYLHGVGALLAVAGGALFVITVLRALLQTPYTGLAPVLPGVPGRRAA